MIVQDVVHVEKGRENGDEIERKQKEIDVVVTHYMRLIIL
jgi:hypothetical protein